MSTQRTPLSPATATPPATHIYINKTLSILRFAALMYEDEWADDKYIVSHRLAAGGPYKKCWAAARANCRRNSQSENRTIKFIKKVLCYYRKYFTHITCSKLVHYCLCMCVCVCVRAVSGFYISSTGTRLTTGTVLLAAVCLAANLFCILCVHSSYQSSFISHLFFRRIVLSAVKTAIHQRQLLLHVIRQRLCIK